MKSSKAEIHAKFHKIPRIRFSEERELTSYAGIVIFPLIASGTTRNDIIKLLESLKKSPHLIVTDPRGERGAMVAIHVGGEEAMRYPLIASGTARIVRVSRFLMVFLQKNAFFDGPNR